MVRAKDFLANFERPLGVALRCVQIAFGFENLAEVIGVTGHVAMIRALDFLIDPQRALEMPVASM